MPEDWTVAFDGFEFAPIPQSWLYHPAAKDRVQYGGPRLFVVSAATYGSRTLKIRYAGPRTGEVLQMMSPAREHNGGIVPKGLVTRTGWTRSRYPPPRVDPMDLLRPVKEEYLRKLWAGRGMLPGETQRRAVADGGDGRC